jgi:hypothetical protein
MAGNRHATALSMDNDATAAFANGRKTVSNPLELLSKTLGEATARPDVRPGEQGRGGPTALVERTEDVPETIADAPQRAIAPVELVPEPAPQPQAVDEPRQPAAEMIEDDGASFRVPPAASDEVNRGGRPRHGVERKVERTISMDKSLDKILLNLAIIESVRLGRRVSSAEVAVHLMQYGLSNMRDNEILPDDEGLGGLEITTAAPTAVALPKIGGNAR